jgi:hypothetical protein
MKLAQKAWQGLKPFMPNQRSKNKVLLGAFVDRELKSALLAVAQARGLTATAALVTAIHNYVNSDSHASKAIPNSDVATESLRTEPSFPIRPPVPNDQTSSVSTIVDEVWLL